MLQEWIESCLTPASCEARKNGSLYESIAFQSRARRNEKAWRPHWQQCHRLVQEFSRSHSEARSLAVLGSGALFEVPKDFLCERFDRIVLVDQVFPRPVRAWRREVQGRLQVDLIEEDLSAQAGGPCLASRLACDLILSANLISQLHLCRFAALKKAPSESEALRLRNEIEGRHLDLLRVFAGRALWWTDTAREFRDTRTGALLQSEPTVVSALPKTCEESWDWHLAPAPELARDVDLVLRMRAGGT